MRFAKLLSFLTLCFLVSPLSVIAHSGGQTGSSQAGCTPCHGGQAAATTVTLEGSRTVRSGQTGSFTFVVAHATNANAGFNVSIRQGGGNAGTLTPQFGAQNIGGELTHTTPMAMAGGSARFSFTWSAPAAHGVYTFNGAGNAVNLDGNDSDADDWNLSGGINITVTGSTFTGPAGGTTICRGNPVTYTWTQTGLTTVRLEWSKDNFATNEIIANSIDASTQTFTYNVPGTQAGGDYVVRMMDAATGLEISRGNAVTISAGPVISLQPAQNVLVCEGKPLTLTIGASGSDLQYRWRHNGVDLPGGTNAVLTINTVGQAQAGVYDCVIFGCGGNATSQQSTVTIGTKPKIVTQPTARSICETENTFFTVEATGNDLIYQWLKNGEPIPSSTGNRLNISNATLFDEGDYQVIVRGSCTPEVESAVVRLSITERPLVRIEPTDKNLKAGDSLVLTFDASGEELTYQWLRNGAFISGATQRIYRKGSIARADSGQYSCRVMNKCDTVITRNAIVKVTASTGPGKLELASTGITLTNVPSCSTVDTTITGLLINEGGSPITITSISAEPVANISVEGLTAPVTLAPNEQRDVRLKISPKTSGPLSGTVTFFASSGNRTFTVGGDAVTGLAFDNDTVVFAQGVVGDKKCNNSLPLPCAATEVRRIRVTGPGATTWTATNPQTVPFQLVSGQQRELCYETATETGDDALVTVETDAGDVSFVLTRRVISSVDEEEAPVAGIRISPNPMSEELRIVSPLLSRMSVRIVTVTGNTVALLSGSNEIIWNRRDANGSTVSPGLYVLFIEQLGSSRIEKVIVR
ncbi:MAG: immunoglobulin domain-containing protein [Ignavibacteria bacterium]|nr:immunoglobulin domain-containing protein [Ignavibacteria bacterium]